ncbi:MAG: alpha-ketoglutarate-dependent dioxygenase AlkB [Myxococcota bacterium]
MQREVLKHNAWLDFDAGWLTQSDADEALRELTQVMPWRQLPITVFGRQVMQPRLMCWAGEVPYRYSGLTLDPEPVQGLLAGLMERASEAAGVGFNHAMLNLYRDGQDTMGRHADDEKELGRDPVVGSLTLGATRKFVYRMKNQKVSKKRHTLLLSHGSYLVMGGAFQHAYYHEVPRQMLVKEPRINVTFRLVKGPPGWREPGSAAPRRR